METLSVTKSFMFLQNVSSTSYRILISFFKFQLNKYILLYD